MKNTNEKTKDLCMVVYFFDSGKVGTSAYGEKVFECLINGNELVNNGIKVVVSLGDVFEDEIYCDITPFTINDELCTIPRKEYRCKDYFYAVLMEDITIENAKKLDQRIRKESSAYLGMTSIDINSTDIRKQFWKGLLRMYSIEATTLTFFGDEEECFPYVQKAKEYGFKVNYDGFPDEEICDNQQLLFSTRQSSFITKLEQLEVIKGKNDSDRGIMEMNYALVKEVEIAGVQIWKAIEDINRVYIPKVGKYMVVDYLFTSLYQAAQGIERLLKILIELMDYKNSYDKQKVDDLLMSHKHVGMYEFIEKEKRITFSKNERKFMELISRFYNEGRYHRFKYSENDIMELKLLQEFGKDLPKEEEFDEKIKHRYGKTIGSISHKLYNAIYNISRELNIYVYELNCDSVARFVLNDYYKDDLYDILKEIENSKKELLWYAFKKGKELAISEYGEEIETLPFEDVGDIAFFEELIKNNNSGSIIYEFVSNEYDEQVAEDKEKWKERLNFIDIIGNTNICFIDDEWDEENE